MHVVVVGGGVVGTAVAAELVAADEDVDVTLLEKDELGAGTTARSAAVFTWQSADPDRFDHGLRTAAWETYGPLVADGTLSYERVGALSVASSEGYAATLREAADGLREFGLDASFLGAPDLADHGVAPADFAGGLHTPEEGYFDPAEVVAHFAAAARDGGADLREGVAVTDVETADGAVSGVVTDAGDLAADAVVNAAGPWAPALNAAVGADVPLRQTVGPILVLDAGETAPLPFTVFESKYYLRPREGGAIAGRYVTDYADGGSFDPDDPPAVDDAFRDGVADLLATAVPSLTDATTVDEWVGLRTVTPDGRPVVGEAGAEGFVLAAGMSGLGVTLAPAVAGRVADLLAPGGRPAEPDARLAPDRFS